MTTQSGIGEYLDALEPMLKGFEQAGTAAPTNHAASEDDKDVIARELDRSVFDFIHQARLSNPQLPDFQAVRGVFKQDKPLSGHSGFQENTHIQIALRENSCVQGWFLPPGLQLLTDQQLKEAFGCGAACCYVGPRGRGLFGRRALDAQRPAGHLLWPGPLDLDSGSRGA